MTIRLAKTGQDVAQVVDLVSRLVASVNGPQSVDRGHTGAHVARLIHSPTAVVFLSDDGFIAGELMQTVISPQLVAFEQGWYAGDRSGLRLLKAFEGWAEAHGARIKMSTGAGGGVAAEILKKRGYEPAELAWFK